MEQGKIMEALATVKDPQTGKDLVSSNRIHDLKIDGQQINVSIQLPTLSMPGKSELNFAAMAAIQAVYPNAEVNVHNFAKAQEALQPTRILSQVKNIIAVASGKGGVGKSTVSVNLALALQQQGHRVGLIDADLYGPSIPTMLGLQGQKPKVQDLDGKAMLTPLRAHGMPVMSLGFIIDPDQAVVLRGPRLGGIIRQFLADCIWPELDYMIIDLPPGTGDIQLTLVQTVPVTGVVTVTTPQEVAVIDAVKAVNMFLLPNVNVPILGIVENMSWFTPEELPDNKYYLFGEGGGARLAKMAETELLGQIPLVQGIREGGDKGRPVVMHNPDNPSRLAFLEIASGLVAQVAKRNEGKAPTKKVDVVR